MLYYIFLQGGRNLYEKETPLCTFVLPVGSNQVARFDAVVIVR